MPDTSILASYNRVWDSPMRSIVPRSSFDRLEELHLNGCALEWGTILLLEPHLPSLKLLQLSGNRLKSLNALPTSNLDSSTSIFPSLETLFLESNDLTSLRCTLLHLEAFKSLSSLHLSNNLITLSEEVSVVSNIEHLTIRNNSLKAFLEIERLVQCCPRVFSIGIGLIDLRQEDVQPSAFLSAAISSSTPPIKVEEGRHMIIALYPSLSMLDGTTVSAWERKEAELWYLRKANTVDGRGWNSWQRLCDVLGKPERVDVPSTSIKSRLIGEHDLSSSISRVPANPTAFQRSTFHSNPTQPSKFKSYHRHHYALYVSRSSAP